MPYKLNLKAKIIESGFKLSDINNELNLIREDNKANSMTDIEDLFPSDDKENDKKNIDE